MLECPRQREDDNDAGHCRNRGRHATTHGYICNRIWYQESMSCIDFCNETIDRIETEYSTCLPGPSSSPRPCKFPQGFFLHMNAGMLCWWCPLFFAIRLGINATTVPSIQTWSAKIGQRTTTKKKESQNNTTSIRKKRKNALNAEAYSGG